MKKEIIITMQKEGFHKWESAPLEVYFLRNLHRHIFHIKVGIPVLESDREREFFIEKKNLEGILDSYFNQIKNDSCEMIAEKILNHIPYASWVEVFEDGENGSRVERE